MDTREAAPVADDAETYRQPVPELMRFATAQVGRSDDKVVHVLDIDHRADVYRSR